MNSEFHFRSLRYFLAVCDSGFSVSNASCRFGVAQSVVSRSIQALERHFGGALFVRSGKRFTALTPLGEVVIIRGRDLAARIQDLSEVAAAARDLPARGTIRIACTHLQARYILPQVLKIIHASHPRVKLILHECMPAEINDLLVSNRADLGICSELLSDEELMISFNAYSWKRALIMLPEHKFAKKRSLSLKQLAAEPSITYVHGITGRRGYDSVFAAAGLYPNVVVASANSDVIKQFTREGLGIGVISAVAYEPNSDSDLIVRRLPRQFGKMEARVVYRRGRRPSPAYRLFIDTFCRVASELAEYRVGLLS